jgi:putative DNA primase/helicase
VPKELGVVQDGMMLRPDDRDSVKQVVSHWLVELGELDATFRKSDIAQLKA